MKSNHLFSALALSAIFLSSCDKSGKSVIDEPAVDDGSLTVVIDDFNSTRTSLNADGKKTNWTSGDSIIVYSELSGNVDSAMFVFKKDDGSGKATFTIVEETESENFDIDNFAAAYYPGKRAVRYDNTNHKIVAKITATQTYTANSFAANAAPMACNVKNGQELHFKNAFAILKLNLTGSEKISQIRLAAPSVSNSTAMSGSFDFTLSGTNTISVAKSDVHDDGYETLLDCSAMTNPLTSVATPFFIVLPPMPGATVISVNVIGDNGFLKSFTTVTSGSGNSLVANNIVSMPSLDSGTLPGLFSVSPTKAVRFSQGNLQYLGTGDDGSKTPQWRFATNQWDRMLGGPSNSEDNKKGNVTYDGYSSYNTITDNADDQQKAARDLFAWGTSGYNGMHPYLIASTGVTCFNNEQADIAGTEYDWGQHNAISNGGNQVGVWRVLTGEEWTYLLNRTGLKTTASNYKSLTVSGTDPAQQVYGLVILPDGGDNANLSNITTTDNLAEYKALFLPDAANITLDNSSPANYVLYSVENGGYYYSSTQTSSSVYANRLKTADPNIAASSRMNAFSVRLVQDLTNYAITQDYTNGNTITLE